MFKGFMIGFITASVIILFYDFISLELIETWVRELLDSIQRHNELRLEPSEAVA